MVILRLTRIPISLFTQPPSLLSPKPTNSLLTTTIFKPLLRSAAPKTTLSAAEPIPISDEAPEEAPIETPLDRLFVPPETDVPSVGVGVGDARILKGSNIVLSKYARDAQVAQAEFVKSSVRTEDCPSDGLPEFALVGRSNVGKSSLLNSLVRRKRLALTSKKPGQSRSTHCFVVHKFQPLFFPMFLFFRSLILWYHYLDCYSFRLVEKLVLVDTLYEQVIQLICPLICVLFPVFLCYHVAYLTNTIF